MTLVLQNNILSTDVTIAKLEFIHIIFGLQKERIYASVK